MKNMGISGRIAAFFLDSRMTPLLGLVALLLGLFALGVTPREEEPQIDVTMANVMLALPGAGSADVERLLAGPMEQHLAQMQGLDHVYSVSRPGMALLTVQFKVGVPRESAPPCTKTSTGSGCSGTRPAGVQTFTVNTSSPAISTEPRCFSMPPT